MKDAQRSSRVVELLIVIAFILILAALLLPAFEVEVRGGRFSLSMADPYFALIMATFIVAVLAGLIWYIGARVLKVSYKDRNMEGTLIAERDNLRQIDALEALKVQIEAQNEQITQLTAKLEELVKQKENRNHDDITRTEK